MNNNTNEARIDEAALHILEAQYGQMFFGPGAKDVPVPNHLVMDIDTGKLMTKDGDVLGIVSDGILRFAKRIIADFDKLERNELEIKHGQL